MQNRSPHTSTTPNPRVEIEEGSADYSKAMMRLDPYHRAFVEELFNLQNRDYAKAYALARGGVDLTDPKQSHLAQVMGSRWAHRGDVKDAIFAEGARRMTTYVPMIMEMLFAIATDPTHKDQARVGMGILDRVGLGPTSKVDQTLNVTGGVEASLKIDVTDPRTAVAVRKFADVFNLNGDDFAKYLGVELAKKAGLPSPTDLPMTDAVIVEDVDFTA